MNVASVHQFSGPSVTVGNFQNPTAETRGDTHLSPEPKLLAKSVLLAVTGTSLASLPDNFRDNLRVIMYVVSVS